jgi:hypothetical protein
MDTIQVVKEVSQQAWTMWPDDECVIHVAKPAEGLMGHPLQCHFFKVFHEEVGSDWQKCTGTGNLNSYKSGAAGRT